MRNKLEIRSINDDDLYAVSRIYEECWRYAYRNIVPDVYLDEIAKGRWVNTLKGDWLYSLVLMDKDKPVGTLGYCESRYEDMKNYGEIVSIYLLPEYMGKGYGRQLMDAGIAALAKMSFKDAYLWVLEENLRARHFYEKYGFYESGKTLKINIGGKDLTEIQYIYNI